MIIHCKNTLGDGTIIYKDYEVDDPVPPGDDTEATAEEIVAAIEEALS